MAGRFQFFVLLAAIALAIAGYYSYRWISVWMMSIKKKEQQAYEKFKKKVTK
jgi:hypothetical protein